MVLQQIADYIFSRKANPRVAYDLWAGSYDQQPGNLMLHLDEQVFGEMMSGCSLANKKVLDIGCGTGRHWPFLFSLQPLELIGCDVSPGMLHELQKKFPGAQTQLINNDLLSQFDDQSFDVLISTLTVAHIEQFDQALYSWSRVLKPGGEIIITDYHPELLHRGGRRDFRVAGRKVVIKNFVHEVNRICEVAWRLGMNTMNMTERRIDESMKNWYSAADALHVFERFVGTPVIYGLHLQKHETD